MLNKIEKKFLWDWMDDVGRYQLPDLADFRPKWEKAQKLGITTYDEYKEYEENPLIYLSKKFKKDTDLSTFTLNTNGKKQTITTSTNVKFTPNVTVDGTVTEDINNEEFKITSKLANFIHYNQDLINAEEWDDLFEIAEDELSIDEQADLIEMLQSIGCEFEVLD